MKKVILVLTSLMLAFITNAQAPEAFKYQAVVRDNTGSLMADQNMDLRIDILKESITGAAVYSETHSAFTNAYGVVTLEIGSGTTTDDFPGIEWGSNIYFIKLWVNGSEMGTSQLLSVPYALHSKTAEIVDSLNISGDEEAFNEWDKNMSDDFDGKYSSLTGAPGNVSEFSNDAGYLTSIVEVDGDTTNEIQDLQLSGHLLSISGATGSIDLTSYMDDTDDQTLSEMLAINTDAGNNPITNLANPVNDQDAATKAFVTLRVSTAGDTLFLGTDQYVIIPGISNANPEIIPPLTDIDSNEYQAVKLGDQIWMAENLKVTHYADGTPIPQVTDAMAWINLEDNNTDDAYCYYMNDASRSYGALYTWAAAMGDNAVSSASNPSGVQGVCPDGWHLPSDAEWTELENFLADNGYNFDGTTGGGRFKIAKSMASKDGWTSSTVTGAVGNDLSLNNASGFSGLAGGGRRSGGGHLAEGDGGYWWSSTERDASTSWIRTLNYGFEYVNPFSNSDKSNGYSVRCVR